MSEETKAPTPEQAALAARVAELQTYVGKSFECHGETRKIVGYGGVREHQERDANGKFATVHSHTFVMDNGWTPPATEFLKTFKESAEPKSETTNIA